MTSKKDQPLDERVGNLERRLQTIQSQLESFTNQNRDLHKDMKFFESMLLEEYHLLLKLLGKDQNELMIHRIDDSPK